MTASDTLSNVPKARLPGSVKAVMGLLGFMLATQVGMQLTSAVNFNLAYSLGFQEDDPNSPDPFVRGHAVIERGTAAADVVIQGSLLVLALIGLWRRRAYGYACAMGEFAISVYWPTFDLFQESLLVSAGFAAGLLPAHVAFEATFFVLCGIAAVTLYRHRRLFMD